MLAVLDPGLRRELQAILTLYIGPLLSGFSMGFSAVAVPDMKEEMRLEIKLNFSCPALPTRPCFRSNSSLSVIPAIQATGEQLSWFGQFLSY